MATNAKNADELWRALRACGVHFASAGAFSIGINVLFLTSPLYMLQVYDRVMNSGSVPTLVWLTVACGLALVAFAALDVVRSRVLVRAGIRLDRLLAPRVLAAMMERANFVRGSERGQTLRDLDAFRQFITSNGLNALFDAPWAIIYALVVYLVHPALGLLAFACAVVLLILAVVNEAVTRRTLADANQAAIRNYGFTEASLRNAEVVRAMGMLEGLVRRWNRDREPMLAAQAAASDAGATVSGVIKFLRLFMQSLMLGCGAFLAIERSITPGAMFAATLLLGRALQPIEQAVASWRGMVASLAAYRRVRSLLADHPARPPATELGVPAASLSVERLVFLLPGARQPVINNVGFSLSPGEALGVIGATAAGKSTLARLLVGVFRPTAGVVRLDNTDVFAWDRAEFGRYVGYLPQDIELFSGTVAQNISRFNEVPADAVLAAGRLAGADAMIRQLPNSYDTEVGEGGALLSGGQRQRIALARAVFGTPKLVVLDEPNSNLDEQGERALIGCLRQLRAAGSTVILVSHRMTTIREMDKLLQLNGGTVAAYGPRDEVLEQLKGRP